MKTTKIRRAVLCGAVMFALLFSPASALVVRADDQTGHGTPGKGGKCEPVDDSTLDILLEAMESLWLLLPM